MPPQHFGQAETQRTCEVSRTCSVMHHLVRRRSITLWRSRASRVVLLLVPLGASEKEQRFVAQLCALERRTARVKVDHILVDHGDAVEPVASENTVRRSGGC